jgi:hypothetical protein
MRACRQPLTRDDDRSFFDRRIGSSAAPITRLEPGDPDVAEAIVKSDDRSCVIGAAPVAAAVVRAWAEVECGVSPG